MAALTQPSVPLDGSEYTSWDIYRKTIKNWLILAKFNFATPTKNKDKAIYTYINNNCPWRCHARRDKYGIIKLYIANNKHTCDGAAETKRKASSIKKFLNKIVPQFIRINKKTTAQEIIDCITLQFSKSISYRIAFNCL